MFVRMRIFLNKEKLRKSKKRREIKKRQIKKKYDLPQNEILEYLAFRIGLVFLIVLGFFAFLFFRLTIINTTNGKKYEQIVLSQQVNNTSVINSRRGEIWDRNGVRLAVNEKVYNLIIDSVIIFEDDFKGNLEPTVKALAYCFGYDEKTVTKKINEKFKIKSRYVRYQKQISEDLVKKFEAYEETYNKTYDHKKAQEAADKAQLVAQGKAKETKEETKESVSSTKKEKKSEGFLSKIRKFFTGSKKSTQKGKVQGIWFEEQYKRVYPYDTFACDTIGFTSSEQNFGLEAYYNDILSGKDGRKYGYIDSGQTAERVVVEPKNGKTLVSTIDSYIQSVCEKVVSDYDKNTGSKNTSVLVMNPKNGEIYAMASSNPYDLNNPNDLSAYYSKKKLAKMTEDEKSKALLELWQNYCISNPYEPGSTAKIFTIAAALEENVIHGNETYKCDGAGKYGGATIHCYKRSGHGKLNVTESLMYSCNDVLMQIAMLEGKDTFSKYQSIFGIGQKTGIDLPDEDDCSKLYYTADQMGVVDLATNSFGQNFYTTMVQMAAAYSSVVNGGNYYEPHLVKQILDSEGNVVQNVEKKLLRKTVSTKTSEFIKQALYKTCEEGSGMKAKVSGYQIGGKTGTAEKNQQGATGKDETYVVSFIAVAPALDPEVVVYALVDEPNIKKQSDSSQATGVSKAVMEKILPYLNIYPTEEADTTQNTDTGGIEVFEGSIIDD